MATWVLILDSTVQFAFFASPQCGHLEPASHDVSQMIGEMVATHLLDLCLGLRYLLGPGLDPDST